MGFVNSIKSFCTASGVKSILQTKPQRFKGIDFAKMKLTPQIEEDIYAKMSPSISGIKYGRNKIPRFIYHMTNKKNYESMLNDGFIKMSKDILIGDGIFTTELTNFFKRWRTCKDWGEQSLQNKLIQQVSKGRNDIVILRIPTDKLNHDLLKIRSQNILFNWSCSKNCYEAIQEVSGRVKEIPPEQRGNWIDTSIKMLKQILFKEENNTRATHLTEGKSAKYSKSLKQKKQALEYVYKDNIPIKNAEKIGEVNVAELRKTSNYDPVRPIRSIFSALLRGTPEQKGALLLDC